MCRTPPNLADLPTPMDLVCLDTKVDIVDTKAMTDCMNLGSHIVTPSFKPAFLNPKTASCTIYAIISRNKRFGSNGSHRSVGTNFMHRDTLLIILRQFGQILWYCVTFPCRNIRPILSIKVNLDFKLGIITEETTNSGRTVCCQIQV